MSVELCMGVSDSVIDKVSLGGWVFFLMGIFILKHLLTTLKPFFYGLYGLKGNDDG